MRRTASRPVVHRATVHRTTTNRRAAPGEAAEVTHVGDHLAPGSVTGSTYRPPPPRAPTRAHRTRPSPRARPQPRSARRPAVSIERMVGPRDEIFDHRAGRGSADLKLVVSPAFAQAAWGQGTHPTTRGGYRVRDPVSLHRPSAAMTSSLWTEVCSASVNGIGDLSFVRRRQQKRHVARRYMRTPTTSAAMVAAIGAAAFAEWYATQSRWFGHHSREAVPRRECGYDVLRFAAAHCFATRSGLVRRAQGTSASR